MALNRIFYYALFLVCIGIPSFAFAGLDESFLQAVYDGDTKEAAALLDLGAELESRTKKGSTALIVASARGDSEMIRFLLKRGSKVNSRNRYDDTALLLCSTRGNDSCVKSLIAKEADVNSRNMHGWSPLARA
ncbi:MAG: ankyrin repeat domain-containing protein, partial [Nitrospinae bacterium]|nr:ankyrin repeat domain-containing protein [Nitrospinota bacterium]